MNKIKNNFKGEKTPKKLFVNSLANHWLAGISMIEVLIVTAVAGILLFMLIFTTFKQVSKGRDGRRKADLDKIKIAFEDYFNDNNCYPQPEQWLAMECGGDEFKPYLDSIPCDPLSKSHYLYLPAEGGVCKGYRVLVKLENSNDPAIATVGCLSETGCGYPDDASYNYGIAQGVPVPIDDFAGGGGGSADYGWYCSVREGEDPRCNYWVRDTAQAHGCFQKLGTQQECIAVCNLDYAGICHID